MRLNHFWKNQAATASMACTSAIGGGFAGVAVASAAGADEEVGGLAAGQRHEV
jgi:hypothetical protein